jgi:hypothetical protein
MRSRKQVLTQRIELTLALRNRLLAARIGESMESQDILDQMDRVPEAIAVEVGGTLPATPPKEPETSEKSTMTSGEFVF